MCSFKSVSRALSNLSLSSVSLNIKSCITNNVTNKQRHKQTNNQTIKNKIKSKVTLNELKMYDKKQEHAIIIHYTKLTT